MGGAYAKGVEFGGEGRVGCFLWGVDWLGGGCRRTFRHSQAHETTCQYSSTNHLTTTTHPSAWVYMSQLF